MKIIWNYLRPYRWWIILSMVLAGLAQVLLLYDPVIFGKIIDDYVFNPSKKPEEQLVKGVSFWLAVAVALALVSRMLSAFKDYVMRMVVQKFGMQYLMTVCVKRFACLTRNLKSRAAEKFYPFCKKYAAIRSVSLPVLHQYSFLIDSGHWFPDLVCFHKALGIDSRFFNWGGIAGGSTSILSRSIKHCSVHLVRQNRQMSGTITESLRNIELVKSLGLTYPEIRRLRRHTQDIYNTGNGQSKKGENAELYSRELFSRF